tara:strand:- start:36 stop:890 length:855 start_codon:yes stop_codon:yes gene_type:complete
MELIKGKEYKRKELHDFYGGQRQGGIATPKEHPYIFIISSKRGKDHGYIDGWIDENKFFLYTGEGQNGDMDFKSGNKAIRDHCENGKKVLFFEETKKTFIELKAELKLIDYSFIQTLDSGNKNRKAIQFKFAAESFSQESKNYTEKRNIIHTKTHLKPNKTESKGLVTSRVGQGFYRQELIKKFDNKCAVTGINIEEILIASHIVPWRHSNDEERLDVENGILLSPLYDSLFDRNLISFEDNGEIIISEKVQDKELISVLNFNAKIKISEGMKKYLNKHRSKLR